jgi:hypothetical protein
VMASMVATRWSLRFGAALATLAVLSLGGWTHELTDSQYIDANSAFTDTGQTGPAPTSSASSAAASTTRAVPPRWYSGASSESAASGAFGRWRGEPVTIGGAWDNDNQKMLRMDSLCPGGTWSSWNKPLDIAIGAIDVGKGDSWAKAAQGAYDDRWTKNLKKIKQCWGSRNPANLYIRFAHEMNLKDMPWRVKGGEEANFTKAITRYSNLRYAILPKAKIVLCPSDGTNGDLGINLHKLWPGKDARGRQVVNVYGVDTYNSWTVIHNAQEFINKLQAQQASNEFGLELHRQLAIAWGVPFAVCEWSGNGDPKDEGHGADIPVYYQLMNEWFRSHAGDLRNPQPGQLLYEIQFNFESRFMLLPTKVQPKSAAEYRKLTWGA